MIMQSSLGFTLFTLFISIKSAGGTRHLFGGDVSDGNVADLSLLMDLLDTQYTPQCLKVVISDFRSVNNINNVTRGKIDNEINNTSDYSFKNIVDIDKSKPQVSLILVQNNFKQIENIFHYIIRNPEKVTPYSCVTYLLSKPPDSKLISLLSLTYSSKRLTHYFFVYSESTAKAEELLFNENLRKEENVAALVQEQSPTRSYWRVLIRQLLHPSGSPQVLTVNRWSRDTGLTSMENIFPEQMANFYGMKLRISTMVYIPFIDAEETEGSDILKLKPCVDKYIFDTLAEKLNFTYETYMPADRQWGYLKDGHYVGILGEVESGRANFAFDLYVTLERTQLVDFTRTYLVDSLSFITAKVRADPHWRKLLTPFRGTVWICVIASFGVAALLYHFLYLAQTTFDIPNASSTLTSNALMRVMASFLCQSLHQYLWLQAGRVFMGFWFLYAFLVTSYYTTFLTSTLAAPFAPSTIDTLQELVKSGLSYGMAEHKGIEYSYFVTSELPLYQRMVKEMTYYSTEENMKRVAEGEHAYLYYKSHVQLQAAIHNNNPKRRSDLHVATEEFYTSGYSCVIPKAAPYRRTIDAVMKRCLWGGLIDKWVKDFYDYYAKRPQEEQMNTEDEEQDENLVAKDTDQVVFTLNHLQGPFIMLCLGGVGGTLLFFLELLVAHDWSNNLQT